MASLTCSVAAKPIYLELSPKFNAKYPYANETEKKEILNRIIEAISDLFSRFLYKETNLSALKMQIPNPHHYPSEDKIEVFKKIMQSALQDANKPENYYRVIFTRKNPEGILKQSLNQAKIENYNSLFPEQSYCDISIRNKQIILDMGFPERKP